MSSKSENKNNLHCSFCGKTQEQVKKFIVGPNAYICDECVELCYDIIEEEFEKQYNGSMSDDLEDVFNLLKPKEIKEYLDDYVIGQERAKKALSVAVYNHYKRIFANDIKNSPDVELQKSNILIVGPTGVGKTFLAQTLAKMLDVPFTIVDSTSLTEAGYVGEDVENILLRLIQAADGDINRAERGIIYVDEIDKIARKSDNPSITRDVSGEGVQQALLKILEGTIASVPPQGGRKHPHQEFINIDTSNILFICGGAFSGLDKIIEQRLNKKIIGFGTNPKTKAERMQENILEELQPQDLQKYGLIPELIGRLPVLVTLTHLDEDSLVEILTEPKNSLVKQYNYLFEMDNVELEFEETALRAIAKKAIDRETGARGLRAIVEEVMQEIMYDIPSDQTIEKVVITSDTVENKSKPTIKYNPEKKPIDLKKQRKKVQRKTTA